MIHRYNSIESTMIEATLLAQQGAEHGTAVVADRQTAGIGRHGHAWHSEPGNGLYVSIVLRPGLPADSIPTLTLALGLAAQTAVGHSCDLRWPNDLMLNDRKVGGILVQLGDAAFIAGIGINVNHAEMPDDLADIATSLRIETGRMHDREALLARLLIEIEREVQNLKRNGRAATIARFTERSSYAECKRVFIETVRGMTLGTTAGLNPSGFLLVDTDDGNRETILAGGVRAAGH